MRASACCAACDFVRSGADFGTKFSKFKFKIKNFAFEIARDRAKMHAAWCCAACSRPLEFPNICCERQHAVPREISCDSGRISDRNFRGRKILRSKSREIAPKSMPPGDASFLTTRTAPQHLLRASACCAACDLVRFGADFGPKI